MGLGLDWWELGGGAVCAYEGVLGLGAQRERVVWGLVGTGFGGNGVVRGGVGWLNIEGDFFFFRII